MNSHLFDTPSNDWKESSNLCYLAVGFFFAMETSGAKHEC